jgi:hypothetical protein
MKMTVFWDVALCSLIEIYRLSRGAYCLHHQGDESLTHKHFLKYRPGICPKGLRKITENFSLGRDLFVELPNTNHEC